MRPILKIFGILSILLLLTGFVFRILELPGTSMLAGLGALVFILGFAVPYAFERVSRQSRKVLKVSTIILLVSTGLIILGGVFKFLHLPGAYTMFFSGAILIMVYFVFFARESEGRKLQLRKDRQLAAILFTDIVGFTAMMGEDEDKALRILDKNRKIQKGIIRKHRGKWLKEMGDGSMIIFYTATEAVASAMDIQHKIQELGSFNVRMGIHISEIVFTDSDVFGDGVNVASRISDKAAANEICISEAVYQNIKNREDLKIDLVGNMELKNVAYKLSIYKINASLTAEGAKIRKMGN